LLSVCHCVPGTYKNFSGEKKFLYNNANIVFKKVSSSFASFDPLDVEGAAFHTFDAKTFGGVTELKVFQIVLFREKTFRKTFFFRCHYLHSICHILDFKQVFQFDSPQISQILKILRKIETREKTFQMKGLFWTVFYHMLSNCSFWIRKIFIIMGGSETLAWNPEFLPKVLLFSKLPIQKKH